MPSPDPNEPHAFEPWGYDQRAEGPPCKLCGLPAVASPHLRWNAQRRPDDDPTPA